MLGRNSFENEITCMFARLLFINKKNYKNYIKYYIHYKKTIDQYFILFNYFYYYYYLHYINWKDKHYINLLKVKFQTNPKLIHINACGIFYFYSPYLLDVP